MEHALVRNEPVRVRMQRTRMRYESTSTFILASSLIHLIVRLSHHLACSQRAASTSSDYGLKKDV